MDISKEWCEKMANLEGDADVGAGYMRHTPTRVERFWRWCGFRYQLVELPDDLDTNKFPGWMMTEVRVGFSFADRLRLLLTGRVHFSIRQATSVQVDEAINATSIEIKAPGCL